MTKEEFLAQFKPRFLNSKFEPIKQSEHPAITADIPGGWPCPICDCKCIELEDDNINTGEIVVQCTKNPTHLYNWMLWGG